MAGLLGNVTNTADKALSGGDEQQGQGGLLGGVGKTVDGVGNTVGQTTDSVGNTAGQATQGMLCYVFLRGICADEDRGWEYGFGLDA